MTRNVTLKARKTWRSCIDRLLWITLITMFGWAAIGWVMAINGQDDVAAWALASWVDVLLLIAAVGSTDDAG